MNEGNHGEITEEIVALIKEDNLNNDAALRLILANQLVINRRMKKTNEVVDEVKEDVSAIKLSLERYPSVMWMWFHRRKTLIAAVLVLMLMYTVLFGVVNISDIRQALLSLAGLPPDLGIATPTPLP